MYPEATRQSPEYFIKQSAVIPYREGPQGVEILPVTNRRRQRWIVPKGVVEPFMSAAESARKEAVEEAGVEGEMDTNPLGRYQILFAGTIGLTQYFAVVAGANETILSALTRRILGTGPLYYLVQIATVLILSVAANTSFNGFPRLGSVLAKYRYLPNQFVHLGDRLVFSIGIMILSLLTGLLIIVFRVDSHALVPLFAIGAFLAFTLSQAGMVAHWFRERGRHWQLKAFIKGLGATTTLVALFIVAINKFLDGAWMVIILIPLLVVVFQKIRLHYNEVANELTLSGLPPSLKPPPDPRVVIPISGVHRGVINAVLYARSISDRMTAVYVETDPEQTEKVRKTWDKWGLEDIYRLEAGDASAARKLLLLR